MRADNIYNALLATQNHICDATREELILKFIQERLNLSLDTYDHELKMSLDFLERRKSILYLARKVNKMI